MSSRNSLRLRFRVQNRGFELQPKQIFTNAQTFRGLSKTKNLRGLFTFTKTHKMTNRQKELLTVAFSLGFVAAIIYAFFKLFL